MKYDKDLKWLVYIKEIWMLETTFNWTEEEIDSHDDGYIGTKYGVNCFLSLPIVIRTANRS